jgi:hypothetical protein
MREGARREKGHPTGRWWLQAKIQPPVKRGGMSVGGELLDSVDFLEADGSGSTRNIPFLKLLCSI